MAEAGFPVSDPQTYRDNLFELLGDQNPLEVLAQTASRLANIVRVHSVTVLRTRPFEGKWTPNEIVGHLVDGEWVYGYRLRLIVSENNPAIFGTTQDLWVARQLHNDREPSELVDMFRPLREFNLALWKQVSAADSEWYRPTQRAWSRVPGRHVAHVGRSRPLAPCPDRSVIRAVRRSNQPAASRRRNSFR